MKTEIELKSHDTIVVGWDKSGKVTYARTFDYPNEKDAAQEALKTIIDKGDTWIISATDLFLHTDRLAKEEQPSED